MTPEDGFLSDICEHPDEDAPRLVYADWLEDHGRPLQGEFIRSQILLARLPEDDPRREELEVRGRVLLEGHEHEWVGPLPPAVIGRTFERGFLVGIKMKARGFPRLRAVLDSCPTVRHLHLTAPFRIGEPPVQAVASSPDLARLTSLKISEGCELIGPAEVAALAASPHVGGLTALSLHKNAVGDGGLAAVAGSPRLAGLTSLSLWFDDAEDPAPLGVEGVRALASSPHLTRLATLRLGGCRLRDEACRVLAGAGNLAGLHTLDLRHNTISDAMKGQLRERFRGRVLL
jgi:uncharacterized protein (TIGR02996 family)